MIKSCVETTFVNSDRVHKHMHKIEFFKTGNKTNQTGEEARGQNPKLQGEQADVLRDRELVIQTQAKEMENSYLVVLTHY